MKNKKKLWWLTLPIGMAALCFGFIAYLYTTDQPLVDECPTKSVKNEFTLYNDGCCFVLEKFSILLSDESGKEYPIFSHISPPFGKRLTASFPQDIVSPVQIVVSFYYEYITMGYVEFPITDFENYDTLKRNGLLLVFGDGDLNVQSGNKTSRFSYNIEPWADNEANALNAYSKFLNGTSVFYTNDDRQISLNNENEIFYEYAFQDMNNDSISELLIRTNIATYILTYLDGDLSLWWTDEYWAGWSEILDNGDILHICPGGAPTHMSYHYVVLDNNGEEKKIVKFEKYISNEERGKYNDFCFEDKEHLSQEE